MEWWTRYWCFSLKIMIKAFLVTMLEHCGPRYFTSMSCNIFLSWWRLELALKMLAPPDDCHCLTTHNTQTLFVVLSYKNIISQSARCCSFHPLQLWRLVQCCKVDWLKCIFLCAPNHCILGSFTCLSCMVVVKNGCMSQNSVFCAVFQSSVCPSSWCPRLITIAACYDSVLCFFVFCFVQTQTL